MRCKQTGKVMHKSLGAARRAMHVAQDEHSNFALNAYYCNACNNWHVGRLKTHLAKVIAAPRLTRFIDEVRRQDREDKKNLRNSKNNQE